MIRLQYFPNLTEGVVEEIIDSDTEDGEKDW
jgi:hypothetical protein